MEDKLKKKLEVLMKGKGIIISYLLYVIVCYSVTTPTRGKSLRQDYRFMAEHDLPPLILYSKEHPPPNGETPIINIDDVANELPELPSQLRSRLSNLYSKWEIMMSSLTHHIIGLSLEQIQTLLVSI